MLIAYFPGSILSRGKLYWPWASLTTQVVIVEPAFFAPTSTPSMAPSACDVTLPTSAACAEGDGVSPITKPATVILSKAVPTRIPERNFALSMTSLLWFQPGSRFWTPETKAIVYLSSLNSLNDRSLRAQPP